MPCPPSPRARCQALAPLAGSLRELDVNGDGMPSDALIYVGLLTGLTHLELRGDWLFGPGGPDLYALPSVAKNMLGGWGLVLVPVSEPSRSSVWPGFYFDALSNPPPGDIASRSPTSGQPPS
jgi:hypothetical protein